MLQFPISPEKQKQIEERMARLGVRESDLVEDFVKGSGPGGQKINKTSIAVVLRYTPSKGIRSGLARLIPPRGGSGEVVREATPPIEVRCQESRSQALNRFLARRMLVEKLEKKILGEKTAKEQQIAKIRRQKRRRSRRAKEKMLAAKHHRSRIKNLRRRPGLE